MLRKIIKIDEEKCNGCGLCANACHEGAIGMVDGKAKLLRDDYCDGLGDCLPVCPTNAISFETREAAAYDHEAVMSAKSAKIDEAPLPCGCPGSNSKTIVREAAAEPSPLAQKPVSRLNQWPVQIKLAPVRAEYFNGCSLLIAADCSAYAYAAFHQKPRYADRVSETRRRGLYRKTDRDNLKQRYQESDYSKDGSPMLRRY